MLTQNSYFQSVKDQKARPVARAYRDRSQVAVSGTSTDTHTYLAIGVGA
jgi:hypothetical protein